MWCEEPENPDFEMPCNLKLIYEIVSFISFICSLFVVIVTLLNVKLNIMNILILQIIISEMVDEINILLGIIADSRGRLRFENYEFRIYICYTQTFLSVFSCLWTLIASLFISIKLYDIIINKNKIFRGNNFLNRNVNFISIFIPIIISYIFWIIHVIMKADTISLNSIYDKKVIHETQMIKLVFCWPNETLSIVLACIVALLITGNLYFSIFKGYFFLKKMKDTILEVNDENLNQNYNTLSKIKGINDIQTILFLYPIIACIIWFIFFLFIFLFNFRYEE